MTATRPEDRRMTEITDDLPARLLHEEHAGWRAILADDPAYHPRLTRTLATAEPAPSEHPSARRGRTDPSEQRHGRSGGEPRQRQARAHDPPPEPRRLQDLD